jgi:predicted oxidoreductase
MQILELGDFRSGSITAINGRCGKPSCRCHLPNQPGHGPNFRLTRKIGGKSVSETFSSAVKMRKAQREVDAFHRFRLLSQELLEVNEKICQARPVADTLPAEGKKRGKPSSRKLRAK